MPELTVRLQEPYNAYMSIAFLICGVLTAYVLGFISGALFRTHKERSLPRILATTQAQRTARVVSPSQRAHDSLKAFEDNII